MPVLVSLAETRDAFIIIYGILGIIFFFIASIMAIVIGLSVRALIHSVMELLNDTVKPTVNSVKDAAETVRGTTEFVGRTTVSPVIRAYGMFAGVKKGLGVLAGMQGKKKG
jgi:hypothetical protein